MDEIPIKRVKEKEESTPSYKRFMILAVVIIAITAVIFISMYMTTVSKMQYVYTNQTYQNAAVLKQNSVSATVQEIIIELEQMRKRRLADETALVKGLAPSVEALLAKSGDAGTIKSFFAENEGLSNLAFVVYDTGSMKTLSDDRGITGESGLWTDDLEEAFVVVEKVVQGDRAVVYGITDSAFDREMLSIFGERLETYSRAEDTTYWIDSITVLDNGTVNSVRVLDPANPQRVGMTAGTGGTGKGPDTFATDGLLEAESGTQVTHTGEAEWPETDGRTTMVSTVTCAEYYAPYGWAVCGAFRLDRTGIDAVNSQLDSRKQTRRLGIALAVTFAVVLALAIVIIIAINANYFKARQKKLKDQVERDALTGANTRGYGQQLLETAFKRFENGDEVSPIIMVIDVDKFKSINDTFGHDGGDEALKSIVRSAQKVMRGKDCVIRWGGDEFIALCYKLEHARSEQVANRIRRSVADAQIKHKGQDIRATISVGVTWFRYGDKDYNDALKRADEALYQSKELGRNRVCMAGGF